MRPLADVGLAVAVLATPVAAIVVWMLLLNARDRREAALRAVLALCCAEVGLRGMVAIDVRLATWTRRGRVTLDMRLCAAGDVWRVIELLETRLPGGLTPWIVATGPLAPRAAPAFHRAVVAVL